MSIRNEALLVDRDTLNSFTKLIAENPPRFVVARNKRIFVVFLTENKEAFRDESYLYMWYLDGSSFKNENFDLIELPSSNLLKEISNYNANLLNLFERALAQDFELIIRGNFYVLIDKIEGSGYEFAPRISLDSEAAFSASLESYNIVDSLIAERLLEIK